MLGDTRIYPVDIERLIEARVTADEGTRREMASEEREVLLRSSKPVKECEFRGVPPSTYTEKTGKAS
jgi:hypothetical protein